MFHTIKQEQVEFDDFDDNQECAYSFKKSLCSFEESNLQDSFFEAILYSLLFKLSPDNKVCKDNAKKAFGEKFLKNLVKKRTLYSLIIHLSVSFKNVKLSMIFLRQKICFLEYMKEEINFDK